MNRLLPLPDAYEVRRKFIATAVDDDEYEAATEKVELDKLQILDVWTECQELAAQGKFEHFVPEATCAEVDFTRIKGTYNHTQLKGDYRYRKRRFYWGATDDNVAPFVLSLYNLAREAKWKQCRKSITAYVRTTTGQKHKRSDKFQVECHVAGLKQSDKELIADDVFAAGYETDLKRDYLVVTLPDGDDIRDEPDESKAVRVKLEHFGA